MEESFNGLGYDQNTNSNILKEFSQMGIKDDEEED